MGDVNLPYTHSSLSLFGGAGETLESEYVSTSGEGAKSWTGRPRMYIRTLPSSKL